MPSTLAFVLAGWSVKTLLWRETEKETTIFLCGNMNEGSEPVKAKAYPTVFALFIPPRKQLEINVVRLKSTKNLPRKCRVVVQSLQPPGAKNVHFTPSWRKSCREFWSPKIRKYRFLRIGLVWSSTANVACADSEPLNQISTRTETSLLFHRISHKWSVCSSAEGIWFLCGCSDWQLQKLHIQHSAVRAALQHWNQQHSGPSDQGSVWVILNRLSDGEAFFVAFFSTSFWFEFYFRSLSSFLPLLWVRLRILTSTHQTCKSTKWCYYWICPFGNEYASFTSWSFFPEHFTRFARNKKANYWLKT